MKEEFISAVQRQTAMVALYNTSSDRGEILTGHFQMNHDRDSAPSAKLKIVQ